MRYETNVVYPFIRLNFTYSNGNSASLGRGVTFLPWLDACTTMAIVDLTCIEHHKVPSCHDPMDELVHDGFVLTDAENNRWNNQYPRASYGQLSTAADEAVSSKIGDTFVHMRDAATYLAQLHRGIVELQAAERPVQAASLEEHLKEVVDLVEAAGWTYLAQPMQFDGERLDGWTDVILTKI